MRIVMFSGGLASWAEAKLATQQHGKENVVLLFSDTGNEHPDLYRFLHEAAADVGAPLTVVRHPRYSNIFELARAKRSLPNNRMPFCSQIMKYEPALTFVKSLPERPIVHFGLYADETHRLERIQARWAEYADVESLVCQARLMPSDIEGMLRQSGLRRPALYDQGFLHNNCGGGCVRAGKSQWRHLARVNPELYAQWEALESEISALHGRKYTILKDTSLVELRELEEAQVALLNEGDSLGCGCFIEEK